jgi:hypothetical protein
MIDSEHYKIKDRAWEAFSKLPGVHAVGISTRVVAGVRTEEPAIAVFVVKKKSPDQLNAGELVPSAIEGVKTDVVEMQVPRLLQGAPFTAAVEPLPPGSLSGGVIKITPDIKTPPSGFAIVSIVTLTPIGSGRPVALYGTSYTDGVTRLSGLMLKLAGIFNTDAVDSVAGAAQVRIEMKPKQPWTATVNCYVLDVDENLYTDYLRGGIRIKGKHHEFGTLGCIATTPPTPSDPRGRVVALTNRHVLSGLYKTSQPGVIARVDEFDPLKVKLIQLRIVPDAPPLKPIPDQSLVVVAFFDGMNQLVATALHPTVAASTAADVALGIAGAINLALIPGIHATAKQDVVEISGPNPISMEWLTFGPSTADPRISLKAVIETTGTTAHNIIFKGFAETDDYGVFTKINRGGVKSTFEVFTRAARRQGPSDIAESVMGAINLVDPANVKATRVGPVLTITGAEQVECLILQDSRVGQPVSSFGLPSLGCLNYEIGSVIAARLDVDAAVIQIRAGLNYKHQIEGIGVVDGTSPAAPNMAVQKRGHVSNITQGRITAVGTTGLALAGPAGDAFGYTYDNAMIIRSTTIDPQTGTLRPFLMAGDSGSALVTSGPGPVKVVGLLFAGEGATGALATPIENVVKAFEPLGLSFDLAPGMDPNAIQTVPDALPASFHALAEVDGVRADVGAGATFLEKQLSTAESEMRATAAGREYAVILKRHFAEAQALVDKNRRVAAVWHRSGGPLILNAVLRMIQFRDERLPDAINGKPLADCLGSFQKILTRYASPAFSADLRKYAPRLASYGGMTFPELIAALQSAEAKM